MATSLSDDSFNFDDEEKIEKAKQAILQDVDRHSLERVVRKIVPVDLMAIFEMKCAEQTLDRCSELRREVLSFVEIAFDSRRCERMFVNWPHYNLANLRRLLRPYSSESAAHL